MENSKLKKLSLEECQKISLDILLDVHRYCVKNNLTYFIMGGTLLGAVRHGGYIPWDDDIDIMMSRPDYEYFLNHYESDRYKVFKSIEGRYSYSKVYDINTVKYEDGTVEREPLGVDIDIFVLDGIVNDETIMKQMYQKIAKYQTMLYLANEPLFYKKTIKGVLSRLFAKMVGGKRIVKKMEKIASTYDYDKSDYIIRLRHSPNGFTGILPKTDYEPAVLIPFDKYEFYAPKEYKKWLTIYYGDYMKLPPIEKRKAHDSKSYAIVQ